MTTRRLANFFIFLSKKERSTLIDSLIAWFSQCLILRLFDWLIDRWVDWLIVRWIVWLIDWLIWHFAFLLLTACAFLRITSHCCSVINWRKFLKISVYFLGWTNIRLVNVASLQGRTGTRRRRRRWPELHYYSNTVRIGQQIFETGVCLRIRLISPRRTSPARSDLTLPIDFFLRKFFFIFSKLSNLNTISFFHLNSTTGTLYRIL